MIRAIFGAIAVIFVLVLKFSGISTDNIGTTSVGAVAVNRPVTETYKAFADGSKLRSDLGQLSDASQITISLEPNKAIIYRISSTIDSDGTVVKIIFGEAGANSSTVSAEVNVADVRRGTQYLSEEKVHDALKKNLNDIAYALNNGRTDEAKLKEINSLLIALAAVTNSKSDGEAEALIRGVAEKSLAHSSDDYGAPSSSASVAKSPSSFGAPTGISGAPSVALPASGENEESFANQQAYDDPTLAADSDESPPANANN
jgi:hypothetical protein